MYSADVVKVNHAYNRDLGYANPARISKPSQTIMISDNGTVMENSTFSSYYYARYEKYKCPLVSKYHSAGNNFGFADGHVSREKYGSLTEKNYNSWDY